MYTPVLELDEPLMVMVPVVALTLAETFKPIVVAELPVNVMEPGPVTVMGLVVDTSNPSVLANVVVPLKLTLPVVVKPTVPVTVLALLMVFTRSTLKVALFKKVTEPVLPANLVTAFEALSNV